MTDLVRVDRQGPVQIVTINRPEAKNAMTKAAAEGIADSPGQDWDDSDAS